MSQIVKAPPISEIPMEAHAKIKSLSRNIDSTISMLPKNEVFDSNQKATRFSTTTKLVESSQLSNAQSPRASIVVPQSPRSTRSPQLRTSSPHSKRSSLPHSQRSSLPHSQRSSMVHSSQGSRASERASTQMVQPRQHSMISSMVGTQRRSGVDDARSSMLQQKLTGMKNKWSDLKCSMDLLKQRQGAELSEMEKQMADFIEVNVSELFEEHQLLMYDKDLEMDELRNKIAILVGNGEGEKRQARDNENQFQIELIASDRKVRHLENENQLLRDLLKTKRNKLKCEMKQMQREIANIEQAKAPQAKCCHECDDRYSPRNTMARIRESTERAQSSRFLSAREEDSTQRVFPCRISRAMAQSMMRGRRSSQTRGCNKN